MSNAESVVPPVMDAAQLIRIESLHRGFLYQHLYAVACLFLGQNAGATTVLVERDEDIEIAFPDRRIYVQVKSRLATLTYGDIEGALPRFDSLRLEHAKGRRKGKPIFVVAANVLPGPSLLKQLEANAWPADVTIHWPGCNAQIDRALPAPQPDINGAFSQCAGLAASLPFGLLAPETLVWKLTGTVMAAAAGNPPRTDHAFAISELTALFDQLVIQLQDFPAPPPEYRSHANEPALQNEARVRIISGYSGSGKTSWVSQAAAHATDTVVYFDVIETPGPALASSLARELAARLFGRTRGGLGEVLLPGATGPEILRAIGTRMAASGDDVTIVLDNGHRVPPADLYTLVREGHQFKFIILCQPSRNLHELEALLRINAEPLKGWSTDTVAAEAAAQSCYGDFAACQRLIGLTAGMPLYVQNALSITATEYDGSVRKFCDELEAKTHVTETAQELILARVFDAAPAVDRSAIGVLSLSDIPLERSEASTLLANVLTLDEKAAAGIFRRLRSGGFIEVFGSNRLKVHDAMRLLGQTFLASQKDGEIKAAQNGLKEILATSLQKQWELAKLHLYLRMLAQTGDIKTLVQFATDELFHELGVVSDILSYLETAAASDATEPDDRFWALDGLVFSEIKRGVFGSASKHLELMSRLIKDHDLSVDERLAVGMKRMHLLAAKGSKDGVIATIAEVTKLLPDTPQHVRIFRYNAAQALFKLGRYDIAIQESAELIKEYYGVLGITPEDVLGRNGPEIWPLLKGGRGLTDDLKHLADCLDLNATASDAAGEWWSPFGRIHAMKFYDMAKAPDSLIRVGQDLVDEFVRRNDFTGAREVIETNLLPNVVRLKMLDRIIPVRSQYAVILAYCRDFDAADAEMARLAPYEAGLDEKGQSELRRQRKMIARIRRDGPPPQWIPPFPIRRIIPRERVIPKEKVGRNSPCPCGSGMKYKKCHGSNT